MANNKLTNKNKARSKEVLLLANRIKELRLKSGYSNYEFFAYDNDLPRAQYGRYEKGEDLRFTSLIRIIKTFGISPKEFFSKGFEELI